MLGSIRQIRIGYRRVEENSGALGLETLRLISFQEEHFFIKIKEECSFQKFSEYLAEYSLRSTHDLSENLISPNDIILH